MRDIAYLIMCCIVSTASVAAQDTVADETGFATADTITGTDTDSPLQPFKYFFKSICTKNIDASTEVKARAFGIPLTQTITTEVTFEAVPVPGTGILEINFISITQITGGETEGKGLSDEEKLASLWPGQEIAISISENGTLKTAADATTTRSDGLTRDSEYLDYNLIALLLGGAKSSNITRSCIRDTTIQENSTINDNGEIVISQVLVQDNKTVKMSGKADFTGKSTVVIGEDGQIDSAVINLRGRQERNITIFGSDNLLIDNIEFVISLARENVNNPSANE